MKLTINLILILSCCNQLIGAARRNIIKEEAHLIYHMKRAEDACAIRDAGYRGSEVNPTGMAIDLLGQLKQEKQNIDRLKSEMAQLELEFVQAKIQERLLAAELEEIKIKVAEISTKN